MNAPDAAIVSAPASAAAAADDEGRWRAVLAKDRRRDGEFVFAVRTTGIFCRPSCGARTPKRENVSFFAAPADARAAGYRACLRCRPEALDPDPQRAAVERACRRIEAAPAPLSLGELADVAGMSRYHFARVFRKVTGVTPMAFQQARRRARVEAALGTAPTVTAALYEAGFNSASRFYAGAGAALGMTPTAWRRGGEGETIRCAAVPCALGVVLVAATARGVCAIELGDAADDLAARLRARLPRARFVPADSEFGDWVMRVVDYVREPRGALDLPLDIRGTAFQQRVWDALRAIPAGATATYAEVAARIGAPEAARAVAQACAANAVAVAVPCHRVVRADGGPGGYRWGVARKRELLRRERRD